MRVAKELLQGGKHARSLRLLIAEDDRKNAAHDRSRKQPFAQENLPWRRFCSPLSPWLIN